MLEKHDKVMLRSKDLKFRLLTLEDCNDRYVSWLNNPQVNQYLETRHTQQTLETLECYLQTVSMDKHNYHFAICIRESGEHIGNIKIGPINQIHQTADISYFIGDPAGWGKGYATQAINCIVSFAFEQLKLARIQASCYVTNIGSMKVLEKCGFSKEGELRDKVINAEGQRESIVVFGLLRGM